MTNEEAIKRLKSDIYKYSDFTENPNENEFWTAFDMAIKALEQQPCEDATLKDIFCMGCEYKEQEPKIGRWIEHFDESGKWYECDQCHTDWGGSVNYCPNCGAKMQEVEE